MLQEDQRTSLVRLSLTRVQRDASAPKLSSCGILKHHDPNGHLEQHQYSLSDTTQLTRNPVNRVSARLGVTICSDGHAAPAGNSSLQSISLRLRLRPFIMSSALIGES